MFAGRGERNIGRRFRICNLGRTGDHQVIVVAPIDFAKPAALVEVLRRIVRVHSERDTAVARSRRGSQCLKHQWPAVSSVLKFRLQRDAELRSLGVDRRQADTNRQKAHPTCARIYPVHLGDDADVSGQAPVLGVDAYSRDLQHFDRTQPSWRRVPQGDVKPVPELVLISRAEGTELEQVVRLTREGTRPRAQHERTALCCSAGYRILQQPQRLYNCRSQVRPIS